MSGHGLAKIATALGYRGILLAFLEVRLYSHQRYHFWTDENGVKALEVP